MVGMTIARWLSSRTAAVLWGQTANSSWARKSSLQATHLRTVSSSDLNMLVSPGGQERTEAEYRALYAAAGFELTRVIPTRSRISLIEGTPV